MPKLPADLPENWTRGQIVSPNGTETGLTEKHGYNYLMKQVNNTQTEVNNINTALTDVAQQETVDEIKNKIGTEADADTQPTLFGRLAQLKNMLLEKLAELLTKVTGIDGKIGTNEDSAGTSTLFGQVKDISEKMPTGAVKSVQRGIINIGTNGLREITTTISEVDPNKSIVILTTGSIQNGSSSYPTNGMGTWLVSLTSNSFTIKASSYNRADTSFISWQVIECF